jgi:hypothetical protein
MNTLLLSGKVILETPVFITTDAPNWNLGKRRGFVLPVVINPALASHVGRHNRAAEALYAAGSFTGVKADNQPLLRPRHDFNPRRQRVQCLQSQQWSRMPLANCVSQPYGLWMLS